MSSILCIRAIVILWKVKVVRNNLFNVQCANIGCRVNIHVLDETFVNSSIINTINLVFNGYSFPY